MGVRAWNLEYSTHDQVKLSQRLFDLQMSNQTLNKVLWRPMCLRLIQTAWALHIWEIKCTLLWCQIWLLFCDGSIVNFIGAYSVTSKQNKSRSTKHGFKDKEEMEKLLGIIWLNSIKSKTVSSSVCTQLKLSSLNLGICSFLLELFMTLYKLMWIFLKLLHKAALCTNVGNIVGTPLLMTNKPKKVTEINWNYGKVLGPD